MICQNCGNNEANIRYTQIINGIKKEIALCSKCAREMGVDKIEIPDFPINFNSFMGDFFNDYAENTLLPNLKTSMIRCKSCGTSYDDFIDTGMFGCSECYNTFSDPIDSLLKNLNGTTKHIGRGNNKNSKKEKIEKKVKEEKKLNKEENEKERLKKELENAVAEERYEDAADIKKAIDKLDNIS
ncbi:MAG: hypothetical protein IKG56_01345 [Clostridia bacterium]|nr:hypothetical protein [Clostridia bacterium]